MRAQLLSGCTLARVPTRFSPYSPKVTESGGRQCSHGGFHYTQQRRHYYTLQTNQITGKTPCYTSNVTGITLRAIRCHKQVRRLSRACAAPVRTTSNFTAAEHSNHVIMF